MLPNPSLPVEPQATVRSPVRVARLFYPVAAGIIAALAFVGFSQFYLHGRAYPGREIPPPIRALVIAHGAAMSLWLVLLLVQPVLIARRQHRTHMMMGRLGAGLAAVILGLGLTVAVRSAAVTPPETRLWGLAPKPFMAIPFFTILIFAAFVGLGLHFRRKPMIHRSMMLLASLTVLAAGVSRIDLLNNLYVGTVWERLFGPFLLTLLLGVLLLVTRSVLTRRLDRSFAIGLGALIVAAALIMQIAPTGAWAHVTSLLVR